MPHTTPFHDQLAAAQMRARAQRHARQQGGNAARQRLRRWAALAAAIAVPAMAAPDEWRSLDLSSATPTAEAHAAPMPFEQPGESFPGSAFYYLQDAPRMALVASGNTGPLFDVSGTGKADAAQLVDTHNAGPAARPFALAGSGLDKARALQCLTSAVYYEAASETLDGQRAVAQVVLNRVDNPSFPGSVCGVVFQGSERNTGCQFSFTCDGSLDRKPLASAWDRAQMVARDALSGVTYAPVGLATHYHTIWINPAWAPSLTTIGTIGAHRFYRRPGAAGQPAAFDAAYAGHEPLIVPQRSEPAFAHIAPVALSAAPEAAQAEVKPAAPSAAKPAEAGLNMSDSLPQAGGVRAEYAHSGRWINKPR